MQPDDLGTRHKRLAVRLRDEKIQAGAGILRSRTMVTGDTLSGDEAPHEKITFPHRTADLGRGSSGNGRDLSLLHDPDEVTS